MVAVSSLVGKLPIVVRLASKTMKNSMYPEGYTFRSNDIVITSITPSASWLWTVFMDTTNKSYGAYFDSNFQLTELEGEEKDKVMSIYKSNIMKNLAGNLHYSGTIGSDPEIFVEDKDGKCIPAFYFLGSKENPDRTSNLAEFGDAGDKTMYWDGYQAEFTTLPSTCMEIHTNSLSAGLRGIYDASRKYDPNAKLSMRNVMDIPFEDLQSAEEQHVAFGCMPSYNVYGLTVRMPPAREAPFRSSGGHIHFGCGKTTEKKAAPIVKSLDAILGVACVSLFASVDDPKRRILYGLPGEYRLPPHGIEYRPLSSAWLCHPFVANLVFDLARKAFAFGENGLLDEWKGSEEETINTIIRCDVDKAREIMERNQGIMLQLLKSAYPTMESACHDKLFSIIMNGFESAVADPNDLETNWSLGGNWTPYGRDRNVSACMPRIMAGQKI